LARRGPVGHRARGGAARAGDGKRLPRRCAALAPEPPRRGVNARGKLGGPRAAGRRLRRSLPSHPDLGGAAVRARRHHLGAGALLRARLTMHPFDLPSEPRIAVLSWPTRILLGAGALKRLAEEVKQLGMERPLLVTDKGVVSAGLAERVIDVLGSAGLVHVLF